MKKMKLFKGLRGLLLAALCLALTCTWASAAGREGSIRVTLTDDLDRPVAGAVIALYHVGETDGRLTDGFSGAGITPASLLSTRNNARNSTILSRYAAEKNIAGQEQTTDRAGQVFYGDLTEGIYLVLCKQGQRVTFDPFLVYIPTVINGVKLYDIDSLPKAEDVDSPDPSPSPEVTPSPEPSGSPEPSASPDPEPSASVDPEPEPSKNPEVPQTGVNVWPVYLLLVLGTVLVIVGLIDLCRNWRKRDE